MTTTLVAPYASTATFTRAATAPAAHAPTAAATLAVSGMGRGCRRGVEKLLCELPDAPTTDDEDAIWFTRWQHEADGTYCCRETLRAPAEALDTFAERLDAYAKTHGFVARVTPRPYDGAHV